MKELRQHKGKLLGVIQGIIKERSLILLALPTTLVVIIFNYIPMYGLILPFKKYKFNLGFFGSEWSGFDNFKYLFQNDYVFRIIRHTVLYNLAGIFLSLVLSVTLALMINEVSRRHLKIYQTTILLPYFLSWVVVSYILLGLLDMEYGMVNNILKLFGQEAVLWYNEPKAWPFILVFAMVWKNIGYFTLIYYGGLIGISKEYYEAASIDGAKKMQQIWHISLPLLKPLMIMLTILSLGRIIYGDFGLFYNLPRDIAALRTTTDILDTFVYRTFREFGDIGMASAAGFIQSVVGFCMVLTANLVVKKINDDYALF